MMKSYPYREGFGLIVLAAVVAAGFYIWGPMVEVANGQDQANNAVPAAAPADRPIPAPVLDLTTQCMEHLMASRYAAAIGVFSGHTPLSPDDIDQLKITIVQQRNNTTNYEPIGYELVDVQWLGQSLIRLRYLERCEVSGLMWNFDFYRADKEWVLVNLAYSDKVSQMFK